MTFNTNKQKISSQVEIELEFHKNNIEFEIIGSQNEATKTSLSAPQDEEEFTQFEVKSYKPIFAQKVLLKPTQ